VEFRLLGPFEVLAGGRSLDLGPAKPRTLLAALAVDAGHPVAIDALIDRIWDDRHPRDARQVVYTYIARARRVLEKVQVTLDRVPDGYRLSVDPDLVDIHRFRSLVERARALDPSDPARAAALRDALSLWRGPALGGVPGTWAEQVRDGLLQQRLHAIADWAEAELAQGRHAVVVERLEPLVVEHPFAEPLVASLMRGLCLAGRTAEAVAVYATTRQRIAGELGVEPGPELRALHTAILRGDGVPGGAAARPELPRPAQLPLDVAGFVGRDAELAQLDAITADAGRTPTAVVVSA